MLIFQPPFWVCLLLWAVMGVSMAGIGMSVMHDANHGAYFKSHRANELMGYTLNLLGGSTFNWKFQHNILHHTYTNIAGHDEDIDDKAGMRFSPHTPLRRSHQFQFVYAFLFYGIITLYWVTLKDFTQFRRYAKNGVNTAPREKNVVAMLKIVAVKLCYFFVILVLPVLCGLPFLQVLAGFLLLHFIGGFILTVVFQLAHTVEGTSHPLPDEKGNVDNNWAIHQLNTTVNFSRESKWISWYVGGLNFQVEHHLFPRICHVHYPAIAPIVKQTAEEFGVPYLENRTFGEAFSSHVATLQRFGKLPSIDEAVA
jgi:linoleoyl-CoA desaturase